MYVVLLALVLYLLINEEIPAIVNGLSIIVFILLLEECDKMHPLYCYCRMIEIPGDGFLN
ncbi:NS8 protein [Bottlenose dolphin coronavirus HKU22]|uniref:NS8 protein n=1 Tax=Bottlenose dolphin coronavirus HKU22 TaxID=1433215 RepID=V5TFD3_BWCOV|nr:NS8 protein [Bottlenose dolphin coronavirus HKU22]AHB63517.1 NS8 protein [Bottlenose dolphin coronavirus HKU22]